MSNHLRRPVRKLPSVKKHGLSAVLLLALIALSAFAWLQYQGKRVPAKTGPVVELPLPQLSAPQQTASQDLPDLLGPDNIPEDENPTETISMIGGPKTSTNEPSTTPKTIVLDGSTLGTYSAPLTRAPIQGLSRLSPYGRVPHPAEDGRKALDVYAKPFQPQPGKTYVSVIIGGLGLNPALTQRAIDELPGSITLSFAAQTPGLQSWVNKARAKGHEVLIELPMDGQNEGEAGSLYTLTADSPISKNIKNLDYLLSRAEGYFAVTNYGGESLVTDEKAFIPVLAHIRNAGLGFIYDGDVPNSLVETLSISQGLNAVTATSLIDVNAHDRASVAQALTNLQSASDNNIPIGMGFSYAGTIDGLIDWIGNKPANVNIAPASYALKIHK